MYKWEYTENNINWEELSGLYRAARLGEKKPEDLEKSFSHSMFKCFVMDSGSLVGAGRALADGVDCSYICDVAVLPSHQGKGIGKEIVKQLVGFSRGHRKIILYSNPGKESFYWKLGFRPMRTAMAIFKDQDKARELGFISEI